MGRKVTVTVDIDQLKRFGDPNQTALDLLTAAYHDGRTGGRYLWTSNTANVGTIDSTKED